MHKKKTLFHSCPLTCNLTIDSSSFHSQPSHSLLLPVIPHAPHLPHHRSCHRRRKLTPSSDPLSIQVENHRYWNHDCSKAAQQSASPLYVQIIKHLHCEEPESGTGDGAEEGICCYGGGGTIKSQERSVLRARMTLIWGDRKRRGGILQDEIRI